MRAKNPVTGVPVIDISSLDARTLAQIDSACIEWGFFHVTGHGVAAGVCEDTLARMREFFRTATQPKTCRRANGYE